MVAAELHLGIRSYNLSGGTKGNHENSEDTWCPGLDSNQASLDYNSVSEFFFQSAPWTAGFIYADRHI
jgi:hypothetical protein